MPALDKKVKHDIDVVVDRIVVRAGHRARGSPTSFETALGLHPMRRHRQSPSSADDERPKGSERIIFSAKFACPVSGFTIEEIEPRLFSFNNPYGACPECDGLGTELFFEPELVVPDENLSLGARRHRAVGAHLGHLALLPADAGSARAAPIASR